MGMVAWLWVVVGVLGAWAYSRWRHNFWASRGVPTPPYLPFVGHLHKLYSPLQSRWQYIQQVYTKYGGATFCGIYEFFNPVLVVGDPDLIKQICIKDFDHFVDRRYFNAEEGSFFHDMLSNMPADNWKPLRALMSPTFTSGKMKGMFPLICHKAEALVSFSLKQADERPYVDMKNNFGRFTMDTIASCAFGMECDSLVNENAEFAKQAYSFFRLSFFKMLKFTLANTSPKLFHALRLTVEGPEVKFFAGAVVETLAARKAGQRRGDFLDLLLEARIADTSATTDSDHNHTAHNQPTTTTTKQVLSDRSIVAQSVLFLIAGYDTTASTLAFSSFLLAKNPTQQQRLRHELQKIVEEHGDINYQGIMEAKFLDACIMETLRLYPPAPILERMCTKPYQLPGTDVSLSVGDLLLIPVWSLHHDPRYWPRPEEYLPERFLPENRSSITPCTHMPFGLGPRNCLAMRFALMEAKVALAKLILAADIRLPEDHKELVLNASPFLIAPKDAVNLILTPLTH